MRILSFFLLLALAVPAVAQSHYFPGLLPIRSETGLPELPGVYYTNVNMLLPMHGSLNGSLLNGRVPTKLNIDVTAFASMNAFLWQTGEKVLGADYGVMAVFPTLLTASPAGQVEVGRFLGQQRNAHATGLFDLYVSPLMLTWRGENHQICFNYGFWAPTGGSTGLGYWEQQLQLGANVFLDEEKSWSLSALGTFEINGASQRRNYTKGNYATVEWGIVKNITPTITLGLVGYDSMQISNDSGAALRALRPMQDYQHAIGGEFSIVIPEANYLTIGLKHFREIAGAGRLGYNTTALSFSVPIEMELPSAPPPAQPEATPAPVETPPRRQPRPREEDLTGGLAVNSDGGWITPEIV